MKKRLLSIMMAVALCFSLVTAAFAESEPVAEPGYEPLETVVSQPAAVETAEAPIDDADKAAAAAPAEEPAASELSGEGGGELVVDDVPAASAEPASDQPEPDVSEASAEEPLSAEEEPVLALDGTYSYTLKLSDGSTVEITGIDLSLASHHRYYSYESTSQAIQADAWCKYYADLLLAEPSLTSDLDRVSQAAAIVAAHCSAATYNQDSAGHYRSPYGVFCAGVYTCAGATRALGRILDYIGLSWTHANENQNTHQWCELYMDGKHGYADGQAGVAGYDDGSEQQQSVFFSTFEELKALCARDPQGSTMANYTGYAPLIISEDLTIPSGLGVNLAYQSSTLVVPAGVTMTVNGAVWAKELQREGTIDFGPSGFFQYYREISSEEGLRDSLAQLARHADEPSNYYSRIELNTSIRIESDMTLPEGAFLRLVGEKISLTVCDGAVLRNYGRMELLGGRTVYGEYNGTSLAVAGSLVNEGSISLSAWGSFTLSDSGTYSGRGELAVARGEKTISEILPWYRSDLFYSRLDVFGNQVLTLREPYPNLDFVWDAAQILRSVVGLQGGYEGKTAADAAALLRR